MNKIIPSCSSFIPHPSSFMIIRSILLPTDFSQCAESALPYAADLARQMKARLVCLHVVETMMPPVGYAAVAEPLPAVDMGGQLEESATRELPKLGARQECSGLDVEEVIARGDAAGEIVRVARERDIDLIVISSHGRTGLGRMIFGSTAESVVRHAHCPVLVVKPKESEQ
ncbi:MAG: universal stress protein [Acidobacteria bacterium]|nr:universal stress protein [Acidobacteriota bacterium]